MADMRNNVARARDVWLSSTEGMRCTDGAASGQYLKNRIELAFIRGYEAGQRAAPQETSDDDAR